MTSPPEPPAAADVGVEVRRLIRDALAAPARPGTLGDDVPLLAGGVGLDSVKLVELLYACEDRFGVVLALDVLEDETPTVGALIRRVAEARERALRPAAEDAR